MPDPEFVMAGDCLMPELPEPMSCNGDSGHKTTAGFPNKKIIPAEVARSNLAKISRLKFERACREHKGRVVKPTEKMFRLVQLRLIGKRRKCSRGGKIPGVDGKFFVADDKKLAVDSKKLAVDCKNKPNGFGRSAERDGIWRKNGHKISEQEFVAEALHNGKKTKSASPVFSQSNAHSGTKNRQRIVSGEAQRQIAKGCQNPEKRKTASQIGDEAKQEAKRRRLGKGNAQSGERTVSIEDRCSSGAVGSVKDRCSNGADREPRINQRKRQRKQMPENADLELAGRKVPKTGDVSTTLKLSNPVKKERLTTSGASQAEISSRERSGKEAAKKTRARALPKTTTVEEPEVTKATTKEVKENGFLQDHKREELDGMNVTSDESKISEIYCGSQEKGTSTHVCNSRPLDEDASLAEAQKLPDGLDDQKQEILTHDNINATDIPIRDGRIDKNSPTSVLTEAEGNKDCKGLSIEPEKPPSAYVACDICEKWRRIPVELAEHIEATESKWCCHDNLDKAFAQCSVPQEKSDAEINAELNITDNPNWNENENSDGQVDSKALQKSYIEAAQQYVWTSIERNIYVNRCRKNQTIDEIMVCQCRPPEDCSPGCCGDDCLNHAVNIECIPGTCPCGDLCSNQRFQKKLYAKVKEMRCGKKGYGLRALENMPKDTFIIEYVGEVLSPQEHEARRKEYARQSHKHSYFMQIENEFIDARVKGNLARFINHSCYPNCDIVKWTVNGEICIGFFAKRDLVKGEEITADYNFKTASGAAAEKCACGSANCRGFISGSLKNLTDVVENELDGEEPLPIMVKEESEDLATVDRFKSSPIEKMQDFPKEKTEVFNKVNSGSIVKKPPAVSSNDGKKGTVKRLKQPKTVPASEKSSILNSKALPICSNGHFDGGNNMPLIQVRKVQDILNEMLDESGGIAKRRDVAKHYLRLLVVTAASGDANGEAPGSTRDLSMVLDALLKTKSRSVLVDIANQNGFQLLHNMIKQHHKVPGKIPIIRKLLKILHLFADRKVFTSKQMSAIPSREGVESFEESIWKLMRHANSEVQKLARHINIIWGISTTRKSFEGKQSPHGSSLLKANNQTWRKDKNPTSPKASLINRSSMPGKHEHGTTADGGHLVEQKETIEVTDGKAKGIEKICDPVNEWNSNEQMDTRKGERNSNMGESRQSLVSEKQCSDSLLKDHLPGEYSCVQEQRSFPVVSVSEERQWSQGPRKNFRNKNERWPPRYPLSNRNMFRHETVPPETRPTLTAGALVSDKKNELQHGVQVQFSTVTTANTNQNMIMQPLPSPVGGTPFAPQGSGVGNGAMQEMLSPHMPVAYGIPLELFQKLHGVPVGRSVDTSAAGGKQPRESAIPCRIPCEHFSMQQTTNVMRPFHSSGGLVSLPGFPHDPSVMHSGVRPHGFHHTSQVLDNQIPRQGFIRDSKKSESAVMEQENTLEPEPPVPGLSPPRLPESSNSTRRLSPFDSVLERNKTSVLFREKNDLLYKKDRQALARSRTNNGDFLNPTVKDSANKNIPRYAIEQAAKACSSMSCAVDGDIVSHTSLQHDFYRSSPSCMERVRFSSNEIYSPEAVTSLPASCLGGPKQNKFSSKFDIESEGCRTVNRAQTLVHNGENREAREVAGELVDVTKGNTDCSPSHDRCVSRSLNAAKIQPESLVNEVLGHVKDGCSQDAEDKNIDKDFNPDGEKYESPMEGSQPAGAGKMS